MSVSSSASTTAVSGSGNALGEQQFLQLLVAQLQNQDPLSPVDNTEFVAQLAQFSALQQEQANGATQQSILTSTQSLQAQSLVGKTIEYTSGTQTLTDTVVGQSIAGSTVDLMLQSGATTSLGSIVASN